MPFYEFICARCSVRKTERRAYDQMDEPGPQCGCGEPTERIFSPTNNIFSTKAFREGPSWSEVFGDMTERDLAHLKDNEGRPIEVVKYEEALSKPGKGKDRKHGRSSRSTGSEAVASEEPGIAVRA